MPYKDPQKQCEAQRRYQKNHASKIHQRRKKTQIRNKQFVYGYLLTHPCVDCGERDPVVLEFDHRDSAIKKEGVAELMFSLYSLEHLKEEIEKCAVRCANCHRRKTAKQFGWERRAEEPSGAAMCR